jgi:WXG100 family type VII secretion target
MSDRIEVDYAELEKIIQQLRGRNDHLDQQYNLLLSKLRDLDDSWEGKAANQFFDEMADKTLPAYRHLMHVLAQTQSALAQVATIMRAAEEQAGNLFKGAGATGEFGAVGGGFEASAGAGIGASGRGFGVSIGGDSWFSVGYKNNDFFARLGFGVRGNEMSQTRFETINDLLRRYFKGEISYDNTQELMKMVERWHDRVDLSAKLYEKTLFSDGFALVEGIIGNENLAVRGTLLSAEGDLKFRNKIGKEGLDIGIEGNGGLYLARLQGSAEINGIKLVGDAYAGVTAQGQFGAVVNPLAGDAMIVAKGELFAGVTGEVSATYQTQDFKIQFYGSAGYGAGARGNVELGFDDWKLKFGLKGLAGFGPALGGGFKVEVDLQDEVKTVADAVNSAIAGVEGFINDPKPTIKSAINWIDQLL